MDQRQRRSIVIATAIGCCGLLLLALLWTAQVNASVDGTSVACGRFITKWIDSDEFSRTMGAPKGDACEHAFSLRFVSGLAVAVPTALLAAYFAFLRSGLAQLPKRG
jgi:hypothetical protein